MATRTISTKLRLEGENEYKASLANINRELSSLGSRMKLVESEFRGQMNSLGALQAKQQVYNDQLSAQGRKLELYKTQLEKAQQAQTSCANNSRQLADGISAQKDVLSEMKSALATSTDGTIKLYDQQGNLVREFKDGEKAVAQFEAELKEMSVALRQSEDDEQRAANTIRDVEKNVNNAQVAYNDLNDELKQNSRYLDEAKNSSNGCATSIDKLGKEIDDTKQKSEGLSGLFKQGFLSNIASNMVRDLWQKLKQLGKQTIDTADNINTLSTITGQSSTRLQELQYAGGLLDVELSTITDSLKRLINNMDAARNGTGDALKAFKMLGINIFDANGKLRDSNKVFYEAIDALGKLTSATERDAAAQNIFGKSATDLNPLIKAGADEMERLSDEAHTAGAVMSEEAVDALDAFGDKMDALKTSIVATIGEGLAPFVKIGRSASEVMADLSGSLEDNGKIQALIDKYRRLSGEVGGSSLSAKQLAAKTEELTQVKYELIEASNGVISAVDIETGRFDAQLHTLETMTEAEQNYLTLQLEQQVVANAGVASKEKAAEAEKKLAAAQEELSKATERYKSITEAAEDGRAGERGVREAEQEVENRQQAVESALAGSLAIAESSAAAEGAIRSLVDNGLMTAAEAAEKFSQYGIDVAEILGQAGDAANTAIPEIQSMSDAIDALNAEYQAAYESARASLDGQVSFWQNMGEAATASISEMQSALDSQVSFFTDYKANLETLMALDIPGVDLQPLLNSISDGTPEAAARAGALADAVAQGNTAAIEAMANTAAEAAAAKDELAAVMAEQATNYSERYADIVQTTGEAVAQMDKSSEAAKSGRDTLQGYINGANGMSGALGATMRRIAQNALNEFKRQLDQRSPSRKMYESGDLSIEGYILGVSAKERELKDTMSRSAKIAVNTYNQSYKDAQKEMAVAYDDSSAIVQRLYAAEIPQSATIVNDTRSTQTINHTGTIRVEGVNDAGEMVGVVDIVIDQLRRDARI